LKKHFAGLLILLLLICIGGCASSKTTEFSPPDPEIIEHSLPEPGLKPEPEPLPETVIPPQETPEYAPEEFQSPVTEEAVPPEQQPVPEVLPEPELAPEPPPETLQPSEPEETAARTLPILMYHHVVPDGSNCNDMTVTVSKLEKDIQWLNEHGYETILPRQLIAGAPLPEKPILITFDDGYRSNYELAYPLFQQYDTKAVISIMVYMQEVNASTFMSWDMCREMAASGLVEIGSHTYKLHNLDGRAGNFTPGGINGIQRDPNESDAAFQTRVLDDLQLSHDLIEANVGQELTFFAYPFGIREKDAEALIESLFPVTVVTATGMADLSTGTRNLTRWTVTMNTDLASILQP